MTAETIAIPDDLAEVDQWLLWRRERGTKVPYQRDGRKASSTDPATWCTFDEALAAYRKRPHYWAGIGFVFYQSDPFCGLDLDNCLDEHGEVKQWAQGMVERFSDTYMEISPSGRGLKIWARGSLPANMPKVPTGDGGIEMYDHARYFAVTWQAFHGAPLQIEDHDADVRGLYDHLTRGRQAYRVTDEAGKIRHGTQHLNLVSIAGTLRARGVCDEAVEACLQAINKYQCERPGPARNISRITTSTRGWVQ